MRKAIFYSLTLLLFLIPVSAFCQVKNVTGKITGENGVAVPLATIHQKGTKTSVSADETGQFSITVSGKNPVLVISSVNFQTLEVPVGAESVVNVTLQSGGELTGVVVTALGIKRQQRSLGYSAQSVNAQAITESHQPNIINALQGKIAGVTITSSGGGPGQGSNILVRGINSLNLGTEPLFVIDGIPIDNNTSSQGTGGGLPASMPNRAADINPEDIESINILRGGAATALYGLRGANGVVVITTKTARTGKFRVNYAATYGIDQVDKFPAVQSKFSQGFGGQYDPGSFWPEWGPTIEKAKQLDPTHPDKLFNQYKRAYQNGNQFRNTLTLSGRTEKASLSSSVSYFKQNGTIPWTWYQDISVRMNGRLKFNDKFNMGSALYYFNTDGNFYDANRFNENLSYWSPRWDVRDFIKPDGTQKTYGNNNPWWSAYTDRFRSNVDRIIGSLDFTFSPVSWATATYRIGMDYYADKRTHTQPGPKGVPGEVVGSDDNGLGFVGQYRNSFRQINSNLMITLNHDWNNKIKTTLRVGHDLLDRSRTQIAATGSELVVYNLFTLGNAKVQNVGQYDENYRIIGAYGELTTSYKNYLFLTVTGRNDWTSSLEKQNRSFFYPSASLSYIFSDMFKLPEWMNESKFRLSLAQIGKDANPYSTSIVYIPTGAPINDVIRFTRNNAAGDPSLKPELTTAFEVGTDLNFLNNRLGLNFTWYRSISKDLIMDVSTAPGTGQTSITLNAGEIRNKGVELTLTGKPLVTKNLTWETQLNFSANRNKILSVYKGLDYIPGGGSFGYGGSGPSFLFRPGYSVGDIYGTYWLRYYGNKPEDPLHTDKSLPQVIGANGFPVRAPASSQKVVGNSMPDWIGSITNTLKYKGLSLSFMFDTQEGLEKWNQLDNFMAAFGIAKYTENRNQTVVFPGVLSNGTPNTKPVWLGQGVGPDNVNYGSAGYYRAIYRGVTENFVQDASWIRLRTISVSYTLPASLLKRTFIDNVNISFTGNNLWLSTKYNGFDPEASDAITGDITSSSQAGFTYPPLRNFLFSINVNF
ncbi:MAG: SusC/RagA family TonB-linked outer membrane protein [Bacteroidetes bacterium]|nr:SusC/RagA family TonB-linked outer membrane protein [Bacteroidota bacterium]MBS1931958.1 SusC/RagA family TonB-linked outer membrane protein [Bacteroidota bacterium]